MPYYPGSLPPPSAASAIFTVTQQAGIIAGTGMTALNGLSGAVQTISTGTTGTDFNVVSSGTDHKFNIPTASATNRGALSTTDWSTFNSKQDTLISGTNIKTINSTSLLGSGDIAISSGLTVGTTAIASGTIGRVLFQGTGNVLQQSAGLSFATANNQLNIGTSTYLRGGTSYLDSFANGWGLYNCGLQSTFYGNNKDIWNVNTISLGSASASARLDVRAQGALSTDVAFRVRNSANTVDILKVQGDAGIVHNGRFGLNTAPNAGIDLFITAGSGSSYGIFAIGTYGVAAISARPDTATTNYNFHASVCARFGAYYAGNAGGGSTVTGIRIGYVAEGFNANTFDNIGFKCDIANTGGGGSIALDIVNGNFRFGTGTGTKLGTATTQKIGFWNATPIVQPTTAVAASTFVANTSLIANDTATFDGYTIGQVVKALRNTGILA
jgi:hypothetical protein